MHALTTSATAAANASATTAGALANSRGSARVAASKRVVVATPGRVPVADRRAVVASVATQSETVAPTVDAPPAKTVYDAVLYSFAEDGSATILTRADLDAVNAATHVNAVAMSADMLVSTFVHACAPPSAGLRDRCQDQHQEYVSLPHVC